MASPPPPISVLTSPPPPKSPPPPPPIMDVLVDYTPDLTTPLTVSVYRTATYKVALRFAPSAGETVTLTYSTPTPNVVSITRGAVLTFDSTNWSTQSDLYLQATGNPGTTQLVVVVTSSKSNGAGSYLPTQTFVATDINVVALLSVIVRAPDSAIVKGSAFNVSMIVNIDQDIDKDVHLTLVAPGYGTESQVLYVPSGTIHASRFTGTLLMAFDSGDVPSVAKIGVSVVQGSAANGTLETPYTLNDLDEMTVRPFSDVLSLNQT